MARNTTVSLSLAVALLAPAAASAGTVTVSPPDTTTRVATFTAKQNEHNVLAFTTGGPEHIEIADEGAPLSGSPA